MDMSYLKDKPIAILGAGGVGKTMAGDCALAGVKARLWDQEEFAKRTLARIETGITLEGEQLSLYNFSRRGTGFIEFATTDLAKAVKGAGNIIIGTIATVHEDLFRKLIPLLEDGQVIHIVPDNYGTLIFRRLMREMNCTTKVIVGGWCTSPYGARVLVRGGVVTNTINIEDRVMILRGAALPDKDTPAFLESAQHIPAMDAIRLGEGFVPAITVMDTNFSNVNPVIHVPGAVLGAAVMQNFESVLGQKLENYSLYAHALCPAVADVQAVFWEEEKAIAKAMDVGICRVDYDDFFSRSTMYGHEYMGKDYRVPFEVNYKNKFGDGPFTLENRYITEDVPVGCYVYQQLGKRYGVPTPVIDSMVTLSSAMLKRDLIKESKYTLDYLGIGHMSHEQLHAWLQDGVYS